MKPIPALDTLTREEKIGQMLCLGWQGTDAALAVNDQALAAVRGMKAGSMIVMGRNVRAHGAASDAPLDPDALRRMTDTLQESAEIPLLIATDQEGGRVARLGPPFTVLPSARIIGEADTPALTVTGARLVGEELAAVGINWDFAPVADIDSNPANPVIGDRSFGATPARVCACVEAFVAGFDAAGILACAKHFPGHGDTALDSHLDLPTLPYDLAFMEARELAPFRAAIRAGVASIMTAHILFPALDTVPATLSPAILTGLLREAMGFDGILVTDCLEMKAVADRWGVARAAVLAAIAGADVLLVCHTPVRQQETFDALCAAADSGELPLSRIDAAVGRVLAAKRRLVERGTLAAVTPEVTHVGTDPAIVHALLRAAGRAPQAGTVLPTTLGESA